MPSLQNIIKLFYDTRLSSKRVQKKRSSGLLIVVFIILLLILAGIVGFGYVMNHTLNRIEKVESAGENWVSPEEAAREMAEMEDPEGTGQSEGMAGEGAEQGSKPEGDTEKQDTISPEDVVFTKPEKQVKTSKVKNILLIGQDRRPGEKRARSDTMILCSINVDTQEIKLISFMRDLFVPFPEDYLASRMNHAFAWGGMSMLDQIFEEDFGVTVDGNVVVDFQSFVQVMGLIAPIEIELKDYEVGYLNRGTNWGFRTGVNALNAEQLLAYTRIRYAGHGDWERTDRQRTVLSKAFDKVRKLSLKELTDLMDEVLPYVTTDMSNAEILSLLYTVATNRMGIAGTYRIPIEGSYTEESIYGMAVLVPDLEQNSAFLHQIIYRE